VQLELPFLRSEPAPPGVPPADRSTAPPPVVYVRVRRARRYILRVRPDGTLRVTIPRGGSRAEAAQFVVQQQRWVEREQGRVRDTHAPRAWTGGTTLLFRGEPAVIRVAAGPLGLDVRYADRRLHVTGDLVAAGRAGDLRPFIERDLRAAARAELPPRLLALAAEHGLTIARVMIRNQRSRWGSCSRRGVVALNFRLVQMPPAVRDYVLIHELMHLKQPNHSVRFWRLVEKACPSFREAERWLKRDGRALF
jgi:predicted metal-dependent hydrolase